MSDWERPYGDDGRFMPRPLDGRGTGLRRPGHRRWHHNRDFLSPDEFAGLLERLNALARTNAR